MKYSKLISKLQETMKFKPTQQQLADILNVKQGVIGNRAVRDSNFSDSDIEKIEKFYCITLDDAVSDCVEIEHISINPSCGKGTMVLDTAEVTPVKIGKEIIKNVWNTRPEDLKLLKASGDSMQETINDNDLLLVDVSKVNYNNGGIFLLTINNDWFIKRLRLRMTGELDIISDNNKYPIETLKPDTDVEIKVIGRVIKNLSRGL